MRVAIYDRVEPPISNELPLHLVQTCSQRSAAILLIVAIPVVMAIAAGSLLLVFEAAYLPAARTLLAQHPALGLEILAAITFWLYLLGLPVRRLFNRITLARTVQVTERTVTVNERGCFRAWTWSAPLSSYTGLAHHLRTSLSATRHELILVHPQKDRSVLISLAASMPQTEVDRVAEMLGQKEISSGALYRFGAPRLRWALPTWRPAATPSPLVART
jgi:hypothetical protein